VFFFFFLQQKIKNQIGVEEITNNKARTIPFSNLPSLHQHLVYK